MTFRRVRLSLLTIWNIFLVLPIVSSDHDYMPGYHRRLHPASYTNKDVQEISDGVVKTINILIEEQARRRFLEHLQQLRASGSNSLPAPSHRGQDDISEHHRPTYSYQLPLSNQINPNEPIHFAVGPNDPRYYDKTDEMLSGESLESVGIYPQDDQKGSSANEGGNARLSAPLLPIQPKIGKGGHGRNRTNSAASVGIENSITDRTNSNAVLQQPVELGNRFGMYLIAMIAGVSAAVTVALISVAFGWYTLHKRNKAAADVEYPAYGVTGPNRDSSAATAAAAGDRKLAQNAQMYHYQHQKQQIIAMENTTRSSIHSEQPSEDENEEGDYTVYECPGLAPTGEMEVKNPLFLEDAPGGGMSLQSSLSADGPAVGVQYIEKAIQPQTRTNNK